MPSVTVETPPAPAESGTTVPPQADNGTPLPAPAPAPAEKPTVVPVEVTPDVAVLYANGKKQAVAVDQYFKAGDLWFQLLELGPKTMKISVVGGGFAGGKNAVTIRLDHPVTLVNTATGVEYSLLFTKATTGIATTSAEEPATATAPTSTPAETATTATTPVAGEPTTTEPAVPPAPGSTTTTSSGS
jgi:hypothetical protein